MVLIWVVVLASPFSVSAKTKAGTKPGSFFYFLTRRLKRRICFSPSIPKRKPRKRWRYAEERLAEAEESAGENKPEAVAEAMENYQENISLAEMEAKAIKDEAKTKTLLSTIASSTSKHQEILMEVLEKQSSGRSQRGDQKRLKRVRKDEKRREKEIEVLENKARIEQNEDETKEKENEEESRKIINGSR